MSVKKRKKTTKKRKVSGNIDKTIKKNIKNAVNQIPQMIVEERSFDFAQDKDIESNLTQVKTETENNLKITYQYNTKEYKLKQKLMWFGVTIFTSTIIFMWFLVTNATFFDVNKNINKSQEAQLLNESTQKIKEIFN